MVYSVSGWQNSSMQLRGAGSLPELRATKCHLHFEVGWGMYTLHQPGVFSCIFSLDNFLLYYILLFPDCQSFEVLMCKSNY